MIPRRVYLAGPIKGLTFAQATEWRVKASIHLATLGILTIDPVERELSNYKGVIGCSADGLMSSQRAIVTKDRRYVEQADAVLAYLDGAKAVSIGTCVEFGWADAHRKPIVTVMGQTDVHNHSFIRELSGWVVPTLDEALYVLHELLRV